MILPCLETIYSWLRPSPCRSLEAPLPQNDIEGLGDANASLASARFGIGAKLDAVPDKLQFELLLKPKEGLVVTKVDEGSAAAKAGIIKGDVISKVGETGLMSQQQFVRAANQSGEAEKPLVLTILRGEELKRISVTPAPLKDAPPSISDNPFAKKPKSLKRLATTPCELARCGSILHLIPVTTQVKVL